MHWAWLWLRRRLLFDSRFDFGDRGVTFKPGGDQFCQRVLAAFQRDDVVFRH
jgi:hypothetical protein